MAGAIEIRDRDGDRLAIATDGSIKVTSNSTPLAILPNAPTAANILSGNATVSNSAAASTIITIPAGRTWYGNIDLETCNTGAANAGFTYASVIVTGTNATPASGTVILKAITHPGGNTAPSADAQTVGTYVVAPVGNSVTVQIQLDTAATTFGGSASCNGYLI